MRSKNTLGVSKNVSLSLSRSLRVSRVSRLLVSYPGLRSEGHQRRHEFGWGGFRPCHREVPGGRVQEVSRCQADGTTIRVRAVGRRDTLRGHGHGGPSSFGLARPQQVCQTSEIHEMHHEGWVFADASGWMMQRGGCLSVSRFLSMTFRPSRAALHLEEVGVPLPYPSSRNRKTGEPRLTDIPDRGMVGWCGIPRSVSKMEGD